jgi:surfactin synthase thioesterase subunit
LSCTVEAWGGDGDDTVTPQHLDGWAPYAGKDFVRRQFPGGHYFCQQRLKEILPILEGLIP